MTALATLEPLPWDSDFLGFSVGRLTAIGWSGPATEMALAAVRNAGCRLVYLIFDPADELAAAAARHAGATLADRKITFARPLAPAKNLAPPSQSIVVVSEYTPQLESLAWQSGEYSRFRLDRRFGPLVFQKLYSQWLCNSLTGGIARQVLAWHDAAGTERGLLTLGEKNGRADIGLLAVDEAVRGQHVGQQLVAAAGAQASAWGYSELQVVTQGDNEPACRFYAKCGFTLAHEEHIYHWWLQ